MQFFEHESCGQCTPCRAGTTKAVQLMQAPVWDAPLLGELSQVMRDASICGLGQTMAAHRLCSNLPTKMRFAHVDPGAGHYDVIDARRITGFVRDVAKQAGMTYDQIPDCAALPPQYAQETAIRIQGGNNDNTGARIIHIPPKPNTA